MKLETLPALLPGVQGLDLSLRIELGKALDYLAAYGTAADKAKFSLGLAATGLVVNDGAVTTPVALAAAARLIVNSTTEVDIIFAAQYFEPTRAILASQFAITTGVVTSVAVIGPNALRITGTGIGTGDTLAFTASAVAASVLRYSNWVAAANQAAVGTFANPILGAFGAGVVDSATQITITLAYPNTGVGLFGAFAVNNGGSVSAVAYPAPNKIVLTGTGYASGDTVTYTAPGGATNLDQVAPWKTYTVASGDLVTA